MKILINILISSLAIMATSYLLPGIHLYNFSTAIVVAVVLSLLNIIVKPILIILTLPINILTLGLFTFVINALIILLVSSLVPGFFVDGLFWALMFAIVSSLITTFLNRLT